MKHLEIFTGRVGQLNEVKELANGNCVVNFSVAETPRIKKDDVWTDGTTIWTNVSIFGDEARNFHRSVKPGTFVTVIGTRSAYEFTDKDTQQKRTNQTVVADEVSIAITKFHFVQEMGNVSYAKDGIPAAGAPAPKTAPKAAPKAAPAADPFAEGGSDDPFGDDDDPFGLND